MRTRVVITALALRREDLRNVRYASELEYFATEMHLAIVPCVIFSSQLIISFGPLCELPSYSLPFQVFPFALHCSISLRSAEVLTDNELDQASKINNALSEKAG